MTPDEIKALAANCRGEQGVVMNMLDLHLSDALTALALLKSDSIDAIVTDPPAGIGFMGKTWDKDKGGRDAWIVWLRDIMVECLRVLKPGGHALVWALPRTSHWTATALEDAGFEIRDVGVHLFGTGFPKSLDVSKALDKSVGAEREIVGKKTGRAGQPRTDIRGGRLVDGGGAGSIDLSAITAPATDAAKQWSGWGTALKPAAEHWILARKPLIGTVAANVLAHGTGALNIDGCRIETTENLNGGAYSGEKREKTGEWQSGDRSGGKGSGFRPGAGEYKAPSGRWPANVTLDEEAAALLDEQSGERTSGKPGVRRKPSESVAHGGALGVGQQSGFGDTGGASRFFYVAKGSKSEKTAGGTIANTHPTVKSVALMRWLVRLITPPGGVVLDCFAGSGTTGVAAMREGHRAILIESNKEYFDIARARLLDEIAKVTP